ncbi:MAG: hypothetical protein ACRBN8_46395 [Nannocystales bacterium]
MFAYLGYRLFIEGVFLGGAEIRAKLPESAGQGVEFTLGRGGPGLVFCFFGASLVLYAIYRFEHLRVPAHEEQKESVPLPSPVEQLNAQDSDAGEDV